MRSYILKIPLTVQSLAAPGSPEQATESLDISSQGVRFATDLALSVGASVHVFLRMPKEVVQKPAPEWCCKGRIIHIRPNDLFGKRDVGMQFLYYDVVDSGRERTT